MIPKIYECLDIDSFRPIMNLAKITREQTVASDAHILVVHKTRELFNDQFADSLPEDGILVGREALKDLSISHAEAVYFMPEVKMLKVKHSYQGREWYRYYEIYLVSEKTDPGWNYPEWEKVWPSPKDKIKKQEINFNPRILNNLAKGMGCTGLSIQFYSKNGSDGTPMTVEPLAGDYKEVKGLIMPMMKI